jgi:beta-glucanase (GH16 family)
MKIYFYSFCVFASFVNLQCFSQSLNTTNVDDNNPPYCYNPVLSHSNYGPNCHCEWEKINNINLSSYPCNTTTSIKILDEDFNEPVLDFNIWKIGAPWGSEPGPFGYAGMPFGNNLNINSGYLYMQPKVQSITQGQFHLSPDVPSKDCDFTDAYISSLMNWGYGIFEIRCKMADNPINLNHAFWLMGDCKNEIDVFETFDDINDGGFWANNPKKDHVNMCFKTTAWSSDGHCGDDGFRRCERAYRTKLPVSQTLNQWHTYTLFWDQYSLQLEVDGIPSNELITSMFKLYPYPSAKLCTDLISSQDYRKFISYPYAEDYRMNLILQLAVREKKAPPVLPTSLGSDRIMMVDYVKVWQNEVCGQIKNLCGTFDDKTMPSVEYGNKVNISPGNCGWTLLGGYGGKSLFSAVGEDEVILLPGFNAEATSVFSAYIQPCVYSARVKAPIIDSIMLPEVLENENIINVSPNPNNGIFNITFSESVYGSLKIYNSLGGIVYQEYLKETVNQKTVNLSDNKSGFYYIVLQTIEKTYSSKFIIND